MNNKKNKANNTGEREKAQKRLEFQYIVLICGFLCFLTACYPILAIFFVAAGLGLGIYCLVNFGPSKQTIAGMVLCLVFVAIAAVIVAMAFNEANGWGITWLSNISDYIRSITGAAPGSSIEQATDAVIDIQVQ